MDLRSLRRELRVDYLLEGSVRRSSARVRIGVELIDVKDQTLVWAEIFEQRLTDLFSIQSEVARRVARSLAVELLPGSPAQQNASSISPEAHEAYLKGRYFWHKMTGQSVLAASRFFEEAIAICPNFGPAYAGLADCYAQMGSIRVALLSSAEALDKTKPLALQALQLDDGLSEAHNALALIRCWYELDWKGAAAEFRRALELDPDSTTHAHWHALLLVAIGEPEQALFEIQRGRDIDPLSPVLNTYAGAVQWFLGEYDLALRQLRYASQLDASYYRPYLFMGRTLWAMGQREEAFAMLCEAQKRAPENLETVAFSAAVDASMGRREAAIAAAGRVLEMAGNRFDPALLEAVIYTALGEYDTAFQCIERAINSRATPLYILRIDPAFRPLSADPRYRSCLLRIGLPA
jgi:tetratricopeptide (TPR) repeat protein